MSTTNKQKEYIKNYMRSYWKNNPSKYEEHKKKCRDYGRVAYSVKSKDNNLKFLWKCKCPSCGKIGRIYAMHFPEENKFVWYAMHNGNDCIWGDDYD